MLNKISRIPRKVFSTLFQSGKRIHTPEITLIILPTETPHPQFAIIVGKSIDKRAAARNRIKRLLRTVCMRISPKLPPRIAIAILVKKNIATQKLPSIETLLLDAFHKANLLS